MIDLNREISGSWHFKAIRVDNLLEALRGLPADAYVTPNTVGNLLVGETPNGPTIGWIDLNEEKFHYE